MKKYAHRHIQLAISERDILKEKAWGKDPKELTEGDFQDWFFPFCWDKVRGMSMIDRDGHQMDEKYVQEFGFASYPKDKK